ncbi:ImcF-related family protein [Cupriavidus basilensis]
MLAQPERVDAAFLAQQLVQHWTTDARIPRPGKKQDVAERFCPLLCRPPEIEPRLLRTTRAELVAGTRQALLAAVIRRGAMRKTPIYRGILDSAGHECPDLTPLSDSHGPVRMRAAAARNGRLARNLHQAGL